MDIITCKNCSNNFTGQYCNNCGQPANTGKINLKFLVKEIYKTFIHFDSGFFYTTKELFLNPGKVLNAFISGARIKHFKPFSYLLFISAAYILLVNSAHITFISDTETISSTQKIDKFIRDYYIHLQFVFIIVYSLLSVFIFHYKHLNFYEFFIIHTYLAGQRILINICFLPLHVWSFTAEYNSQLNFISYLIGNLLMIWTYTKMFSHKNTLEVISKIVALQICLLALFVICLTLFLS